MILIEEGNQSTVGLVFVTAYKSLQYDIDCVCVLCVMVVCLVQAELQRRLPQQRLSCNDVLSAVLWHVACDIRGRPRPWQGGSKGGHGCLAYPLNLRALHVPRHYCGNALLLNLLAGKTFYRHRRIGLNGGDVISALASMYVHVLHCCLLLFSRQGILDTPCSVTPDITLDGILILCWLLAAELSVTGSVLVVLGATHGDVALKS